MAVVVVVLIVVSRYPMAEGGRESTFPTEGTLGAEIIRFRVLPGPTVHSATFVLGDEVRGFWALILIPK